MFGRLPAFTVLTAALLLLLLADGTSAQCEFDAPAKAKGLKTSLVRAYLGCPGATGFPIPNTLTNAGVPACASFEILGLSIRDPAGDTFATMGSGSR
ncbi:MAG: hypothetical protein ACE5E4_05510 [Candidatus Binatia bacterium]